MTGASGTILVMFLVRCQSAMSLGLRTCHVQLVCEREPIWMRLFLLCLIFERCMHSWAFEQVDPSCIGVNEPSDTCCTYIPSIASHVDMSLRGRCSDQEVLSLEGSRNALRKFAHNLWPIVNKQKIGLLYETIQQLKTIDAACAAGVFDDRKARVDPVHRSLMPIMNCSWAILFENRPNISI